MGIQRDEYTAAQVEQRLAANRTPATVTYWQNVGSNTARFTLTPSVGEVDPLAVRQAESDCASLFPGVGAIIRRIQGAVKIVFWVRK